MENKVTIFNYENNQVRSLAIKGEPWFVLADLCKVLELSTPSRVAERLDPDEKGVSSIHTLGGNQKATIVNESGMYAVILRSDKPQAKPFRKWVTAEVLPKIRKTGAYATGGGAVISMTNSAKRTRKSASRTPKSARHSFCGRFPRKRTRTTNKCFTRELRTF